jgi:hypothetical protein
LLAYDQIRHDGHRHNQNNQQVDGPSAAYVKNTQGFPIESIVVMLSDVLLATAIKLRDVPRVLRPDAQCAPAAGRFRCIQTHLLVA